MDLIQSLAQPLVAVVVEAVVVAVVAVAVAVIKVPDPLSIVIQVRCLQVSIIIITLLQGVQHA
jgi:hypothetical protein